MAKDIVTPNLAAVAEERMKNLRERQDGRQRRPVLHRPKDPGEDEMSVPYELAGQETTPESLAIVRPKKKLLPARATELAAAVTDLVPELSRLATLARRRCKEHQPFVHGVISVAAEAASLAEQGATWLLELDDQFDKMTGGVMKSVPTNPGRKESIHHPVGVTREQVWSAMGAFGSNATVPISPPETRVRDLWFATWLADWMVPRSSRSDSQAIRNGPGRYSLSPSFESPRMWATVYTFLPYLKYTPILDMQIRPIGGDPAQWAEQEIHELANQAFLAVTGASFWMTSNASPTKTWAAVVRYSKEVSTGVESRLAKLGL